MGSGFDGGQEELLHIYGFAALQRGYNLITHEGPGHPLVRRQQGVGLTHEWEKAVTPVVDYTMTLPEVESKRIALVGMSMGGCLPLRAGRSIWAPAGCHSCAG
jgi:alpha-beta hydrolase superfamily lysophospholipase